MCIIVAKKAGIAMPTNEILKRCFDNNPDGAGIMISARNKVFGYKGLMTYNSVLSKIEKLAKKFGDLTKYNVVLHFRIGTHGGNTAANTHPFPVTWNYKNMQSLEWVSNLGMAHNGVIQDVTYHTDIKDEKVSDTMVFIKRVVYPIAKYANIMKNQKLLDALQIASGSKLCFIDGEGNLVTLGKFTENNGILYSNDTFSYLKSDFTLTKPYSYYFGDKLEWYSWDTKSSKKDKVWLSKDDEEYLKSTLAYDYGFEKLNEDDQIVFEREMFERVGCNDLYFSPADYGIYQWISGENEFYPYLDCDEYEGIIEAGDADA